MAELRIYESVENLRALLEKRCVKPLQADLVRKITTHVAQGRLYLAAAARADLAIKPLILFYAMESLAGAVILSRTLDSQSYAAQHGLRCRKGSAERLEGFCAQTNGRGVFPALNDAVAMLETCIYLNLTGAERQWEQVRSPAAKSDDLTGLSITFKEALARIPGLGSIYRITFDEEPSALLCGGLTHEMSQARLVIYLDDNQLDFAKLRKLVGLLRQRHPLLHRSVVSKVEPAGSATALEFTLRERNGLDEFSDGLRPSHPGAWYFDQARITGELIKVEEAVVPMAGASYGGQPYLVQPLSCHYMAEFSVLYVAVFIFSNIVRYYPHVWYHALTGSETAKQPADDRMVALLEQFVGVAQARIPTLALSAITAPAG